MKIKKVVSFLIFLSIWLIAAVPLVENQAKIIVLRRPDLSSFPDVSVDLRILSQTGLAINTIERGQINIFENGNLGNVINLEKQPNGVGLNLYIVLDEFNRTDEKIVAEFISRFASRFMVENLDQVTIITNNPRVEGRANPNISLPATSSLGDLLAFASNHRNLRNHQYVNQALLEAYSIAINDNLLESHATHIILLAGPDTIFQPANMIEEIQQKWNISRIPLHVFEIQHRSAGFNNSQAYRDLAEAGKGKYHQIRQVDQQSQDFTILDDPFFLPLINERLTYRLVYRSTSGDLGNRDVLINIFGQNISDATQPNFSYSIDLQPASIIFNKPTQNARIIRTAQEDLGDRFLYDQDVQRIEFTVNWPDQYPRNISSINLEIKSSDGIETINIPVGPSGEIYQYDWDLRNITQEGDNPVEINVKVVDELGLGGESDFTSIFISNVIPPEILRSEIEGRLQRTNMLAYGLGLLVLVLFIMLFVMRKKIKDLDLKGIGSSIVNQVRKTFLPNRGRQNPVAYLSIISGPENMIGEKLEVFTESMKLGRDPAQADFVFYSPESKSTVSGLHAEIRKQNGQWIIENYSSSGETIVNGMRIVDDRPTMINPGDNVRLGYLAQQCVEFQFLVNHDHMLNNSGFAGNIDPHLEQDEDIYSDQITEVPYIHSPEYTQASKTPSELDETVIDFKSNVGRSDDHIGDTPDDFFSQFDN